MRTGRPVWSMSVFLSCQRDTKSLSFFSFCLGSRPPGRTFRVTLCCIDAYFMPTSTSCGRKQSIIHMTGNIPAKQICDNRISDAAQYETMKVLLSSHDVYGPQPWKLDSAELVKQERYNKRPSVFLDGSPFVLFIAIFISDVRNIKTVIF